MGSIKTIAVIILCISFLTFVALFGRLPVFRKTPIGFLHRLLWIYIPKTVYNVDNRITGGRLSKSLSETADYLLNDAHPIVLIFFLALLLISELLFIPPAWPHLSTLHKLLIISAILLPYITLYLAVTITSTIDPSNHRASMLVYPYDHTLFHPNHICRTCRHLKPSRSKHCSICKVCVQKHDHHCIWLNNCVSRNNYLYFLLLLISVSALLAYGACLGYSILDAILQERFVPSTILRGSVSSRRWSTRLSWRQYADAWLLAVGLQWRIGAVTMLTGMCFPLSTGLFLYHVYLIWAGTTTNESMKWAELKEDILDGLVYRARMEDVRADHPRLGEGIEPKVDWPAKGKWWVVRTSTGQKPTRPRESLGTGNLGNDTGRQMDGGTNEGEGREEADPKWEKVQSLAELENLYDLGFVSNVWDLVFNRE